MDLLGKTRLAPIASRGFARLVVPMSLRDGTKLYMRPASTDAYVAREVWGEQSYSRQSVDAAFGGGIVIDIGAHIGAFAIHAVVHRGASRVLCFEPHPLNYDLLQTNVLTNQCRNIETFPLAVAAHRGTRSLYITDSNTGGHSLVRTSGERMEVDVVPLTDIFRLQRLRTCDLLKVDAEGAEYEVLLKTPPEILERVRCIAAEYHLVDGTTEPLETTVDYLNEVGFDVNCKASGPDTGMVFASRLRAR